MSPARVSSMPSLRMPAAPRALRHRVRQAWVGVVVGLAAAVAMAGSPDGEPGASSDTIVAMAVPCHEAGNGTLPAGAAEGRGIGPADLAHAAHAADAPRARRSAGRLDLHARHARDAEVGDGSEGGDGGEGAEGAEDGLTPEEPACSGGQCAGMCGAMHTLPVGAWPAASGARALAAVDVPPRPGRADAPEVPPPIA